MTLARSFIVVLPSLLVTSCVSYSTRQRVTDNGVEKCFVRAFSNPPSQRDVSCTAPIQPPKGDSEWCTVEAVDDFPDDAFVSCDPPSNAE